MRSGVVQGKKELGGIKKKIREEKQRVREIHKKETSVLSQLNLLDRNLIQKEKDLKNLNRRLGEVTRNVQKATEDQRLLGETIASQQACLEGRLVALYKFGDGGWPQVFFASGSPGDFQSSRKYLASILAQDRRLIQDYRERQALVAKHRERLQGNERELRHVKQETEVKKAEIQKDRVQKSRLLSSVRGEKRIHLAAVKELETASAQLQALVDRLEKELKAKAKEEVYVSPGKGFSAFRGRLPFPVNGRILSTFGKNENPRFNTFTMQKGIEIEAPAGAEIRAVYDGRVLYANWFKGYGKILIIDHGGGYYSLSGHASALLKKVGDDVRAREVVALVGDTGSLKGPCLYFEIRQGGKPLDPLEWLSRGRN